MASSSGSALDPVTQRILELWEEGIAVPAIPFILFQEGLTTETGQPFTAEAIANAIDTEKKRTAETKQNSRASGASGTPEPEDSSGEYASFLPASQPAETPTPCKTEDFGNFRAQAERDDREALQIASNGHALREAECIADGQEEWKREYSPYQRQADSIDEQGQEEREEPGFVTHGELEKALADISASFGKRLTHLSEALDGRLRESSETLRSELDAALRELRPVQIPPSGLPQLPPVAPSHGTKKLGSRVEISGTIDEALMALLESERKERNVSLSTMLDAVVRHYFGKPALSFEQEGTGAPTIENS